MKSLEYFVVFFNQLTGSIPSGLGSLSNNLTEKVDLRFNMMSGSLPTKLGQLTNLKLLILFNNVITGQQVSTQSGIMANLLEFNAGKNEMTGTIPTLLNPRLQTLSFVQNRLSGSLPMFWSPKLMTLSVSHNRLSGSLPTSLAHIPNLLLGDNAFLGTIPSELGLWKGLRTIVLADN